MEQNAAFYAKRSSERFQNGDREGGYADLDRAIELAPNNIEYRWERGRFRYNAEEYAPMLEDITKIVELSSDLDDLQEAYSLLCIAHDALGQDEALMADLNWKINHGFGTDSVYSWRGHLRLKAGDGEGAIDDYTKALEIAPGTTIYQYQRGRAYYQARRYEEAITELTQVLNSDESAPDLAAAYAWRGRAYYQLGKYEEALVDFNKDMALSYATVQFTDPTAYMKTFAFEDLPHPPSPSPNGEGE